MSINTPVLCHPEDAYIERFATTKEVLQARLCDEDGTELASFPASWSDDDIHRALAFANRAYALGVAAGNVQKIREFHKLLEIPT